MVPVAMMTIQWSAARHKACANSPSVQERWGAAGFVAGFIVTGVRVGFGGLGVIKGKSGFTLSVTEGGVGTEEGGGVAAADGASFA